MPTYDYECEKCGSRFEIFQKMTDERLTKCQDETCDGRVKRLIGTGAGLLFKGSGFYITDYRSDSYKAGAKKESGEGTPEKKDGGDSKPEEKKADAAGSKDTKASAPKKAADK